jgi:hypothetical protein
MMDKNSVLADLRRIGRYALPPRVLQAITLIGLASVPAAAQDAGNVMCQAGLGQLLTLAFGVLVIALVLTSVFRIGNGIRKMSDPRSKKKQEGRQETVGGGIAAAGALLISSAPVLLSAIGLSTIQCVQFGGL